jgi:hypothetical protein
MLLPKYSNLVAFEPRGFPLPQAFVGERGGDHSAATESAGLIACNIPRQIAAPSADLQYFGARLRVWRELLKKKRAALSDRPVIRLAYSFTSTLIVRGLATSFFGSFTVSTPFLKSAFTSSKFTVSGSVKRRANEP